MKIQFLGSGAALDAHCRNFHSNLLINSDGGKYLLIDCGTDIRFSLHNVEISNQLIDSIYITHLHADHVGGLEWLGFSRKFLHGNAMRPKLYLSEELVTPLWVNHLSAGMDCLENENTSLDTYFEVISINHNNRFEWEGIQFQLIRTWHVKKNLQYLPSFGLMIFYNDKSIFFTSDAKFNLEMFNPLYEKANMIFHDCEITECKSGVHAHYTELVELPKHIKNKMWLYHYQDMELPLAEADDFLGFVKPTQCFDF